MRSKVSKLRVRLAQGLAGCILDSGSGEDSFGSYLRRHGNKVVSLDIDKSTLMNNTVGTRVLGSGAKLPFKESSFDAIWSCAVIEHIIEDTIQELIRVTRPGGRIIVITPNRYSPFDPIKKIAGLTTWDKSEGHVRLYSVSDLQKYGPVNGETWFVPLLGPLFWRLPRLSHVLILDLVVTPSLKQKHSNMNKVASGSDLSIKH